MGMLSEGQAAVEADQLLKVLESALATEDDQVIQFARQQIYPTYLSAAERSYGSHRVPTHITEQFTAPR